MVIYKRAGLDVVPTYLWWIIPNLYLLVVMLIPLAMAFIFPVDVVWVVMGLWLGIGTLIYIYFNRNPKPFVIELRDKSICLTCLKYITLYEVELMYEEVAIELYKNRYYRTSYSNVDSGHYLYFSSTIDKAVWIELSDTFYTLGAILDKIEQSQRITLGPKELNFVAQYRKEMETYNTTTNRIIRIVIPLIFLSVALLILYMRWGR